MRPDYSQRVIRSGDRLSIVKLSFKSAFDAPQRLVPFPPFLFCGAFFARVPAPISHLFVSTEPQMLAQHSNKSTLPMC